MYAGKSTTLLGIAKEYLEKTNTEVLIYKPSIDTRYIGEDVCTHDGFRATDMSLKVVIRPINWRGYDLENIGVLENPPTTIFIDEAQFFENIDEVVSKAFEFNLNVVCAGLDLDSDGEPFGKMGTILALSDSVIKLKAECSICKASAGKTFRKISIKNKEKILVGGENIYEARCNLHWMQGLKEWKLWTETTN